MGVCLVMLLLHHQLVSSAVDADVDDKFDYDVYSCFIVIVTFRSYINYIEEEIHGISASLGSSGQ